LKNPFHIFIDEAQFTREILGSAVTRIGKANYSQKGIYFEAFTGLSTGLERIGKLCLIVDYYITHNGTFPGENLLKNKLGHDLLKIYSKSQLIVKQRNIQFSYQDKIDDPIQIEILKVLSSFAKGDRYSNIDFLANSKHQSDPTRTWHEQVDKKLYENRVSEKKKLYIEANAKYMNQMFGQAVGVRFQSESREEINNLEKSVFLSGMTESIEKYRRLYILQIIRYWVEIIRSLQHSARQLNLRDIPWFSEIFSIFNNDDSFFLRRKTYEKYYAQHE
tara:strand:- start:1478 stop:2305 length:828 start_codon:yes stop_codon:yes gene_type:complete